MKKLIVAMASVLLLIGGSVGVMAFASPHTSSVEHTHSMNNQKAQTVIKDDEGFAEYKKIREVIDVDHLHTQVVKDNAYKRIIVFKDDNGQQQFKSIYVKKVNRLKVIDFHHGMVFNQVLTNDNIVVDRDKETGHEVKENNQIQQAVEKDNQAQEDVVKNNQVQQSVEKNKHVQQDVKKDNQVDQTVEKENNFTRLKEYATIANHVDLAGLSLNVVKDNAHTRVILLEDGNGQPQFKSIYIKKINRVKIINFHKGLVYNGKVTK